MFHMVRQNAAGVPAVLIRRLKVLARVLAVATHPIRHAALLRHANLALMAGREKVEEVAGLADLERCSCEIRAAT